MERGSCDMCRDAYGLYFPAAHVLVLADKSWHLCDMCREHEIWNENFVEVIGEL